MPDPNQNNQQPPVTPPVIFPHSDLPPLPPSFQSLPENDAPKPIMGDSGSSAPPEIPPKVSIPKKKFGGGKIIATILGLIVLVGGVGAGILLTQQPQLFQQKAESVNTCTYNPESIASGCQTNMAAKAQMCSTYTGIVKCGDDDCCMWVEKSVAPIVPPPSEPHCDATNTKDCIYGCTPDVNGGICKDCSVGQNEQADCTNILNGQSCPGKKTRFCQNGQWGNYSACSDIADSCPVTTTTSAQCTRIQKSLVNTGGNITITQEIFDACKNACPDGTAYLYASTFKCDGINLTGGCQDNGLMIKVPDVGQSITVNRPSCGTVQTDVGCKNSANTWGNLAYSTMVATTACNKDYSPPTEPQALITTPAPGAPSCIGPIKAYDDTWTALTDTQLSTLTVGDVVNFCISGSTNGTYDKAQFMINTILETETTTKRAGSDDFCQSYTILSTDTTINVKAKIHDTVSGWVGETI
jgi:hypothetical protein